MRKILILATLSLCSCAGNLPSLAYAKADLATYEVVKELLPLYVDKDQEISEQTRVTWHDLFLTWKLRATKAVEAAGSAR